MLGDDESAFGYGVDLGFIFGGATGDECGQ
jgi:hypothetical protein